MRLQKLDRAGVMLTGCSEGRGRGRGNWGGPMFFAVIGFGVLLAWRHLCWSSGAGGRESSWQCYFDWCGVQVLTSEIGPWLVTAALYYLAGAPKVCRSKDVLQVLMPRSHLEDRATGGQCAWLSLGAAEDHRLPLSAVCVCPGFFHSLMFGFNSLAGGRAGVCRSGQGRVSGPKGHGQGVVLETTEAAEHCAPSRHLC